MSGEWEIVWKGATDRLLDDPSFGPLVERIGPVRLGPRMESSFYALVRSIVFQQLAGAAASTIHRRVLEALDGDVTPDAVLATPDDVFRGAGLSASKARAIRDLAPRVASGEVPLEGIESLDDREVAQRVTRVWGIGQWTADMFLLFQLRRPDIWPVGDLGVRQGFGRALGLEETPSAKEIELMGLGYRPWRSAVAWYCWRVMDEG